MNQSIRDLELLDLITQDNLDQHTQIEVSARSTDPKFAIERKKALALREVIIDSAHKSLKEELRMIDRQLNHKKRKTKNIKLVIAAIVFIGLSIILYKFYYKTQAPLPPELYAMYYAPHPNVVDPLTKGENRISLSATQLYELGNYDEAIALLKKTEEDDVTSWYLAQAYMASEDWDNASSLFDTMILEDGDSNYRARWFRALIHLKQNELEKAKSLLRHIVESNHSGYREKAKELLDEL